MTKPSKRTISKRIITMQGIVPLAHGEGVGERLAAAPIEMVEA